jgi:predicted  nucleic acid-binding Zn-ribbon protein
MTSKQIETKLTSLKDKITKKRTELTSLTNQQKDLRTKLVEAKKTEKAAPKPAAGKAKKKSEPKKSGS